VSAAVSWGDLFTAFQYWTEVLPGFGMCVAAKSGAGP